MTTYDNINYYLTTLYPTARTLTTGSINLIEFITLTTPIDNSSGYSVIPPLNYPTTTISANLRLYEQSAIQFLQTCTIVFSHMSDQINNNLISVGHTVDLTTPDTFKYYLNLSGQYHEVDTMMKVYSLDTNKFVDFTKEMLSSNPITASVYVVGSPYYDALCQKYPTQTDLIKSIVYPVDIQKAIDAPDFTLLGWGDGYLETTEQDAIIYELKKFIDYASTRWYFGFLNYEAYYAWAFWGCLWQSLPNAIFAARLKYLHTSSTNSFHIWAYLESNGIGDYSDILTTQQALFLYRNLGYINQNRGKQSNLVILANNLLNSLGVGLVGKTIHMNTATKADTCAWTPEFVSTIVPSFNAQNLELIAPETMSEINQDLVIARLDVNNSVEYVSKQENIISLTPCNMLQTKLVEIQQLGIDHKYGALLNTFILDTLVYAITSGLYIPIISIIDPTTLTTIKLTGKEALVLYYYAVYRSNSEQPVNLPSIYLPSVAFRPDVTSDSIPTSYVFGYENDSIPEASVVDEITYYLTEVYPTARSLTTESVNMIGFESGAVRNNINYYLNNVYPTARAVTTEPVNLIKFEVLVDSNEYLTRDYLNVDMLTGLGYPSTTITSPEAFANMTANLFLVLLRYVRYSRIEGSMVSLNMFLDYCKNNVLQTTPYTFTLDTAINYKIWANNHNLTALLDKLDTSTDYVNDYSLLANAITTALVPEDNPIFKLYGYTNEDMTNLYDRLRDLFIQLCSYNIAFLDTNRTNQWWVFYDKIVYYIDQTIVTST